MSDLMICRFTYYPRKGAKTLLLQIVYLNLRIATYPRKGTITLNKPYKASSNTELQLIPVRGR